MIENIFLEIKELKPFYKKNILNGVFSWEELIRLLNLRPFVNNQRLVLIDNQKYSWEYQEWLSDVNSFPPSLLDQIIKNGVCYLKDSSRVNKNINQICKDLEDLLKCPVDAHIFFSMTNNLQSGFGIHNDMCHNLILQIEGKTNFQVWNIEEKTEIQKIDSLDQDPFLDVTLEPGDIIFVPKKYWHRARSLTKRLSISFPCYQDSSAPCQDRHWITL